MMAILEQTTQQKSLSTFPMRISFLFYGGRDALNVKFVGV